LVDGMDGSVLISLCNNQTNM